MSSTIIRCKSFIFTTILFSKRKVIIFRGRPAFVSNDHQGFLISTCLGRHSCRQGKAFRTAILVRSDYVPRNAAVLVAFQKCYCSGHVAQSPFNNKWLFVSGIMNLEIVRCLFWHFPIVVFRNLDNINQDLNPYPSKYEPDGLTGTSLFSPPPGHNTTATIPWKQTLNLFKLPCCGLHKCGTTTTKYTTTNFMNQIISSFGTHQVASTELGAADRAWVGVALGASEGTWVRDELGFADWVCVKLGYPDGFAEGFPEGTTLGIHMGRRNLACLRGPLVTHRWVHTHRWVCGGSRLHLLAFSLVECWKGVLPPW